MDFIVVIPARYASTRLPGKMLKTLAGKTLIEHVVERAQESTASRVVVATDDKRIADQLTTRECEVCMTQVAHQSGSDRLAEVVDLLSLSDDQLVVNVQGDEPLVPGKLIDQVAATLAADDDAVMASAAKAISNTADLDNPNVVKVVVNQQGRALYFSRASIPYARDQRDQSALHHIGIYAYRAGFLRRYSSLPPSKLETTESLEQLRVLDCGESIAMTEVSFDVGFGVDTQADLERAEQLLLSRQPS